MIYVPLASVSSVNDATVNGLGVFVLVAVGVLVAGVAMGQFDAALLLGPLVGAAFGTATYLMVRRQQ